VLVVDTNILVYAADADSAHHTQRRAWLEAQRRKPDAWFSTWAVVYEFLRVTTHPRAMRKPWTATQVWAFIQALTASAGFGLLLPAARHASVLDEILVAMPHLAGNILHGVNTVALMREHGIRQVVTRDADFHRFKGIEVVDPVSM
jgi:uncharacterized protein